MLPNWIHKDFKWNGGRFSNAEELIAFSKQNCPEATGFISAWLNAEGRIKVKTSGATGEPKEIELKRAQMIASARATGTYFDLDAGSNALLCLPLQFIAGKMMLVRAMTLGWNLWSSFPVIEIDLEHNKFYDFTAMVPLQLGKHPAILDKTKKLLLGGGKLPNKLEDLVQSSTCQVFLSYGMTETVSHIAIKCLNKAAGRDENKPSLFNALPGIRLSVDHRNCLEIDAPRIADQKIVTNDLVELVSETSFHWLARYDNVINSGALKLIPELIEEKLTELIDREFFAYGLEDDLLGERLVLVVEGAPFDLIPDLKAFSQIKTNSLERHEVPKEVFFIPEMVRTATGKIQRKVSMQRALGDSGDLS